MTGHAHGAPQTDADFSGDYWEERYRRQEGGHEPGRVVPPSPQLVAEVAGLPPGRALEAGCGEGANAVWLASKGWQVTAVDISGTALASGRARADGLGNVVADRVTWVEADLLAWSPGGGFELVTSHYVHTPEAADRLVARLATAVAPGGTLLVVGHAPEADGSAHGHGAAAAFDPAVGARTLDQERWLVEVAETRSREVRGPRGRTTLRDGVLRARRATVA